MTAQATTPAPFTQVFGMPVRGKIQLDAAVYQLGSLSLLWNLSYVTVRGVRGKTIIRTSAIGLLYFQSCSHCIFEDIIFEVSATTDVPDYRGVMNLLHGEFRNLTFHRCVWRAPRAPINGIKVIVEAAIPGRQAEGRAETLHFYDCDIADVGRMGLEVQNHSSADMIERYHDIIWEGGSVRNTGLKAADGQGVSFSGKGGNCRANTLFDNNLLACIEGVGVRSSYFTGRAQNQLRSCNPLSFTNIIPMWDNIVEDFRTIGRANGEVQFWCTRGLKLRHNIIDLTGGIHIRDMTGLESIGDVYSTRSKIGLFIEGNSYNNRWRDFRLDSSETPLGAFSTIRFYGPQVHNNIVETAQLAKARDGVEVDNLLGARNNRVIDNGKAGAH